MHAVDGGEVHIDDCTFAGDDGGSLAVSGGEVTATRTQFVSDAIELSAGGSLVYRLPAPLGHWINSLGQDYLTLQAGVSYDDFPPACSAGLYGDRATTAAQSSPLCSGLCPAGFTCGLATVTPVVRARRVLPRGLAGGAALPFWAAQQRDRLELRGSVHAGSRRHFVRRRCDGPDALQPGHRRAQWVKRVMRIVQRRDLPGGRWPHGLRGVRRGLQLPTRLKRADSGVVQ